MTLNTSENQNLPLLQKKLNPRRNLTATSLQKAFKSIVTNSVSKVYFLEQFLWQWETRSRSLVITHSTKQGASTLTSTRFLTAVLYQSSLQRSLFISWPL